MKLFTALFASLSFVTLALSTGCAAPKLSPEQAEKEKRSVVTYILHTSAQTSDLTNVVVSVGVETAGFWHTAACEMRREGSSSTILPEVIADGSQRCRMRVAPGSLMVFGLALLDDKGYRQAMLFNGKLGSKVYIDPSQLSVVTWDGKRLPITVDPASQYAYATIPSN